MKYPAIYGAFYNTPHAIMEEKLLEIEGFLRTRFYEGEYTPPVAVTRITAGPRDGVQMYGRVAVVPVMGVMAQRMSMMDAASGGTGTDALGATLDTLVADRGVKAIVLNVSSSGGEIAGTAELADKMLAMRGEKRIVAVANSLMASAAYWIGAQASELVATPTARVGNIGVIAAHTDESAAEEKMGVKTTLVTAGKFKGEGLKPITEDALGAMQRDVNAYYGMFVKAVAKGRGVTENRVETKYGEGRAVLAKDALEAGMIDRIATLEQTLKRLGGEESASAARDRAAQMAEMGI